MPIPEITHRLAFHGLIWRRYKRCGFVDSFMQQWRPDGSKNGSAGADIEVEVSNSRSGQPREIFLHPLRGTEEPVLLAVPARKHDGAERLPALLEGDAERANDFVEGGGAGIRVDGAASNPGVAVVAQDDGFVREAAVDGADDVPKRGRGVGLLVDEIK